MEEVKDFRGLLSNNELLLLLLAVLLLLFPLSSKEIVLGSETLYDITGIWFIINDVVAWRIMPLSGVKVMFDSISLGASKSIVSSSMALSVIRISGVELTISSGFLLRVRLERVCLAATFCGSRAANILSISFEE